jgi:fatty-acyl-CoA synthase
VGAHALIHDASLPVEWRPVRGPGAPLDRIFELERLLQGVPLGASCARRAEHNEVAYIQLSSGTSAPVRAVALTHSGILQNTRAVARALSITPEDLGVSWLPLDNIMGLLGFVVLPMDWGLDTVLIAPERFLSRPQDWLWTISQHRATLTAAPDFAYHACVRRINETDLQGLDLSSLRVAMSGGEPARARHMEAFTRRFRKHGFGDDVFLPVYGLTEATLAVSFSTAGRPYTLLGLNRKVLEREGWVAPLPSSGAPTPYERMHLVSVGTPLDGVQIRVVNEAGEPLGEGLLGQLHVHSTGRMSGYVGAREAGVGELPGGWLATGDVGFFHEQQLYIVTRGADLIASRSGRRLIPDEIELFVNAIDGVRTGSSVAFDAGESHHVVVACEILPGADAEEIELQIRQSLLRHLDLAPDALMTLTPFSVPRTRDGKVQRGLARRLYQLGKLDRRARVTELDGVRRFVQRVRGDVLRLAGRAQTRIEGWWRSR